MTAIDATIDRVKFSEVAAPYAYRSSPQTHHDNNDNDDNNNNNDDYITPADDRSVLGVDVSSRRAMCARRRKTSLPLSAVSLLVASRKTGLRQRPPGLFERV